MSGDLTSEDALREIVELTIREQLDSGQLTAVRLLGILAEIDPELELTPALVESAVEADAWRDIQMRVRAA